MAVLSSSLCMVHILKAFIEEEEGHKEEEGADVSSGDVLRTMRSTIVLIASLRRYMTITGSTFSI